MRMTNRFSSSMAGFLLMTLVLSIFSLGCAKSPANKPGQEWAGNKTYQRAQKMVTDKSLPKEQNPNLARALQDLYMINGCVGVGYDDSPESAERKAAGAFKANQCQSGAPAKTMRFKAYNGSFYCIMTTNVNAGEFKLEEK